MSTDTPAKPVRAAVPPNEKEVPACRICLSELNAKRGLIAPCKCTGTAKWVHRSCLNVWRVRSSHPQAVTHCVVCNTEYEFETPPPNRNWVVRSARTLFSPFITTLLTFWEIIYGIISNIKICLLLFLGFIFLLILGLIPTQRYAYIIFPTLEPMLHHPTVVQNVGPFAGDLLAGVLNALVLHGLFGWRNRLQSFFENFTPYRVSEWYKLAQEREVASSVSAIFALVGIIMAILAASAVGLLTLTHALWVIGALGVLACTTHFPFRAVTLTVWVVLMICVMTGMVAVVRCEGGKSAPTLPRFLRNFVLSPNDPDNYVILPAARKKVCLGMYEYAHQAGMLPEDKDADFIYRRDFVIAMVLAMCWLESVRALGMPISDIMENVKVRVRRRKWKPEMQHRVKSVVPPPTLRGNLT